MKNSVISWRTAPGWILCLIGATVLLGWMVGNHSLVRGFSASPAMTINTAVLFLFSGLSLTLSARTPDSRLVQRVLVPVLIGLPGLILLEHLFDIDLGIDLAHIHAALGDGHARPGRAAPNTCLGFLSAGIVLFLHRRQPTPKAAHLCGRILAAGILLIGMSALLGYFLHLEFLYKFASFNRMAILTAGGMVMLGIGIWHLLVQQASRVHLPIKSEDKRITRLAGMLLTVFAVAGGLSGFALLRDGFEKSVTENMLNATTSNAFSISFALDHVTRLASSVDSDAILQQQMVRLNAQPGDASAIASLEDVASHFAALGFTGVSMFDRNDKQLVQSGVMASELAVMHIDFSSSGKPAELYWQDGLLFKIEQKVRDGNRVIGRVVMESRLSALTAFILELQRAGRSNDLLLCGRQGVDAVCFPTRFYTEGVYLPLLDTNGKPSLPASRALLGESGAMIVNDLRGIPVLAGYATLPSQDLGLVLRTDIEELYAPLRQKLNWLAGLLLSFVIIGTLLLRKWVQPLIARIVSEQRRMNVILEHSHDAFVATNAQGLITDWNRQAEKTFGWKRAQAIGRKFIDLLLPQELHTRVQSRFNQLRHADHPRADSRLEVEAMHCHGNAVPVEMSLAGFHDGTDYGVSVFLRDISERREAERAAAEHAQSLEAARIALLQSQKLEAVGKLTGGVAHDFNNVLQVIGASLQLLEMEATGSGTPGTGATSQGPSGNTVLQNRIAMAMNAVDRGAKLASQLLAFARRQPLQPVVVNLGKLVRGLDELLQRALGEEIEIETIVAGGLWNTLIDPNQLEHVILNLAINARDAMNGTGKLTIEAGNAMLDDAYVQHEPGLIAGQFVLLAISDTGCGMDLATQERAFEPFFTTKPEGQGTGLGLSMVYGFVKQSHGHIRIYSEVGYGTTIKIYLPRSFEAESAAVPRPSGQIVGGQESILVVEDDLAVQATVVDMLRGLGYRVLKANNGDQALRILKDGAMVDLLFTDVVMPGTVRSPELAKQAKQLLPEIRVLFTSGYTQNAIVHGGRLDPGVHLLSKPYGREQLARKIHEVLHKDRTRPAGTALLEASDREE